MNSDDSIFKKDLDLAGFACRFLKDQGAILEPGNPVINALLPKELSQALEVEEYISMARDTKEVKKYDGTALYPLEFQTPLLDKIVSMAGSAPPLLQADLKFTYIKTQGFDSLINDQFEFHRSKINIIGTGEIRTRYVLLTSRFLAQSDEQKEGLLDFSFNLDTGALAPGMHKMLVNAEKEYQTKTIQKYTEKEIIQIHEWVSRYGPDAVEEGISKFVQSMNRRFNRDSLSLDQYYQALEKEMKESLSRTGISDKLKQEREAKIALIPDELGSKKKDLLNKYSIKVSFSPVAVLAVTTPCVKVFISLISGRKKKKISMIYNPVTKSMDPMVCQSCGTSTYSLGVCRKMHLNCISCLGQSCSLCQ
ncbi:hypothetical protein [Desulfobacula sp.]